jgi:hypothetical protein
MNDDILEVALFLAIITMSIMLLSAGHSEELQELQRQQNECYSVYGQENITCEVIADGYYHAYVNGTCFNGTLVYAHGQFVNGTDVPYGIIGHMISYLQ